MAIHLLISCLACALGVSPDPPIDFESVRVALAETRRLSEADDGALWGPPLYGPILVVDPGTRFTVANVADEEGVLTAHEDLFVGRLPDTVAIANTTTDWSGRRWTMLLSPLPGDPDLRNALVLHECFHRIQVKRGIPLTSPENEHLDDPSGRTWLRLEWRALAAALRAEDPTAAVTDALQFRRHRRELFPEQAEGERGFELNEGLAEYTGYRLALDAERRQAIAIDKLARAESGDSFQRTFAYTSGLAYGLLLDEAQPGWTRRVQRRSDLGDMLARAMIIKRIRTQDVSELRRQAETYGLAAIVAVETARDEARAGRRAELAKRFVHDPVLRIDLTGSVQYSYDPGTLETLPGHGTVYGTMELSGPFGILKATNGVLLVDADDGRHVVVPAPADTLGRWADGWSLLLDPTWELVPGPRPGDFVARPE